MNNSLQTDNENKGPAEFVISKRPKTSWIWTYWDEETREIKGNLCKVIVCKIADTSEQIPCGKVYVKSSGSTGNAINHLRNHHDITKDGKINKVN